MTMTEQKPKEKPHCYTCHEEIYFEYGSKIPLDPVTKRPHEHKKKEEPAKQETTLTRAEEVPRIEYSSLIKIIDATHPRDLEVQYEITLRQLNENKCRIKGCQYRIDAGGLFRSIAIYYDMPKEVVK